MGEIPGKVPGLKPDVKGSPPKDDPLLPLGVGAAKIARAMISFVEGLESPTVSGLFGPGVGDIDGQVKGVEAIFNDPDVPQSTKDFLRKYESGELGNYSNENGE